MQAGMKFYEDTAQIYTEMATKNIDQAKDGYVRLANDLRPQPEKHQLQSLWMAGTSQRFAGPYMVDPAAFTNPAEMYDLMAAL